MTEKLAGRNADVLVVALVFPRAKVPVRIATEHLDAGDRIDDSLDGLHTARRERTIVPLKRAAAHLVSEAP